MNWTRCSQAWEQRAQTKGITTGMKDGMDPRIKKLNLT